MRKVYGVCQPLERTPAAKDPEDNVQGGRRAKIRHSFERGCTKLSSSE